MHFPNWAGDLPYSYLLFDNKGNTVSKLKNYIFYSLDAKRSFYSFEGVRYIYNGQIHTKGKSDTLFVVENDRFVPKYVFLTGENHSNQLSQVEYDGKILLNFIHETDNKVFYSFVKEKIRYDAYYDKKIGKTFSKKGWSIDDMNDKKIAVSFFMFSYQYNDEVVILRTSSFDLNKLKENVSPSKYLEITNMLEQLKDEDPVILAVLHLKKE